MARVFHPTLQTTMCHIRTQNGTNLMENTYAFHWATGTPPTGGQLNTLATQLASTVGLAIRNLTNNGWIFREVYCRNIDVEVAPNGTFIWPTGTTGNRTGSQVAANEASGVVRRTGLTGRGQHGRNNISGFVEGDVDGNSLGSTLMALLAQLAIQTLVSYLGGYLGPAIAHIPRLPTDPPGFSSPLQSAIVLDSNIDSEKSRLNSHGR
jgi:hypothetical protein